MSKKILVADDDPGTREFYKIAFEQAGYTVKTADDATSAIIACGEFNPDMLLLDWDMPGGGGKRVFEKVCQLLGKNIPVLFVTGAPHHINVDVFSSTIMILKKPASTETLLAKAETLLK